jgi:hypothetical protein
MKPKKWYNRIQVNYNALYSRRFQPSYFQNFHTNVNANIQFKNLWWAGAYIGFNTKGNDFYESRNGKIYQKPQSVSYNVWIETNFTKKYFANINASTSWSGYFNGVSHDFSIYHRYRFNDKFSLSKNISYRPSKNDVGYYKVDDNNHVLFSVRDRNTVESGLEAKYSFNNKSGISFIVRHYWSKVESKRFFQLDEKGLLNAISPPADIDHQNYNNFYVNAVYTWQFAPGSFINIVWKDEVSTFDEAIQYRYFRNFNRTIGASQNNNLSVKVIYYLDYLDLKKWRRGNRQYAK